MSPHALTEKVAAYCQTLGAHSCPLIELIIIASPKEATKVCYKLYIEICSPTSASVGSSFRAGIFETEIRLGKFSAISSSLRNFIPGNEPETPGGGGGVGVDELPFRNAGWIENGLESRL